MDKVINIFEKQKKEQKIGQKPVANATTVEMNLYEPSLLAFRESYLNTDLEETKKCLRKCRTVEGIFEIFYAMIVNQVIPIVYPHKECAKCLNIEFRGEKQYPIMAVLELNKVTEEMLKEFQGQEVIYTKVTMDQMYRFKREFLAHNVEETTKRLENTKDAGKVLDLVYELMSTGAIPVLWPMMSEFDYGIDIKIQLYLGKLHK